MPELDSMSDFEKQQKAIRSKIVKAADKTESKVLKQKAKEIKKEDDPEARAKKRAAFMLFEESMEMFMEGDMKFDEAIDDFAKAAKAI